MTRSICAAFISILMLPICAANAHEPTEPIETVVAAIRVGATDLAESSAFYRQHFGFQTMVDASEQGYIVLENHGVMIVLPLLRNLYKSRTISALSQSIFERMISMRPDFM